VVVVGRNEGKRLRRCLASLEGARSPKVYVDSGSTDGSVEVAHSMGWNVVELDSSRPFSAARARNVGFEHVLSRSPAIEFVQFVDGDSELVKGWLERAARELDRRPSVGVVCGSLRELRADASVYNRLCDMEWGRELGQVQSCGGICMVRAEAFRAVNGFTASMIAGEEAELCLRLRALGWKIVRLDEEMALHDAAMTRFLQWWRRSVRNGYAYTEGMVMHGRGGERHYVRQCASTWFWGVVLPVIVFALWWPTEGMSLLLFGAYPLLVIKVALNSRGRAERWRHAWLYGAFCVLAKLPQALGQACCFWDRCLGRRSRLIEHKTPMLSSSAEQDG